MLVIEHDHVVVASHCTKLSCLVTTVLGAKDKYSHFQIYTQKEIYNYLYI